MGVLLDQKLAIGVESKGMSNSDETDQYIMPSSVYGLSATSERDPWRYVPV